MPPIALYGHTELRERLSRSFRAGSLPASLLLHGPWGAGKQRLALWIGQLLLCSGDSPPCDKCRSCRYVRDFTHPDLHWYFPRPRLKDADPDLETVRNDYAAARAERAASGGIYASPSGQEGIFVATIRAIVQQAAFAPALGNRKVFIIGDAERMVSQEGADQAANAFLKLLEEPSPKTTIILTSSEPGALLPTIRSRTVALRVPPLKEAEVREFLADPIVGAALESTGLPKGIAERVRLASGTPGILFGDDAKARAITAARKLLEAATAPHASARHAAVMGIPATGARGNFSDLLDALLFLLGERMRAALHAGNEKGAAGASRAAEFVAVARQRAAGNVNPQLVAAKLLRELSSSLS